MLEPLVLSDGGGSPSGGNQELDQDVLGFFVQWVVSERRRQSVVPVIFWYFSIAGGVLLLIYSIHRRDTVFTVGSLLGCFVYMRNLRLVRLEKFREETGAS